MKKIIEEYGLVVTVIIVLALLIGTVMVINYRNIKNNKQDFSQFTENEDAGGNIKELKENTTVITPEGTEEEKRKYIPNHTW